MGYESETERNKISQFQNPVALRRVFDEIGTAFVSMILDFLVLRLKFVRINGCVLVDRDRDAKTNTLGSENENRNIIHPKEYMTLLRGDISNMHVKRTFSQ